MCVIKETIAKYLNQTKKHVGGYSKVQQTGWKNKRHAGRKSAFAAQTRRFEQRILKRGSDKGGLLS